MGSILLKNCYHIFLSAEQGSLSGKDILIRGNRIERIGDDLSNEATRVIDCSRCVVVPGFVNTHHHFYQTLTRNVPEVQDAELFDWLVFLYEIWKHLDEDAVYYSSLLAMGELLKTGCTTTTNHHYVYPNNVNGDLMAAQIEAAETLGMRFSPARGSMSLGKKDGGLPPDSIVQTEDQILEDCQRVIERYHDAGEFSMRRIVLGPCSPFSVTEDLMKETVKLGRTYGVLLHTHLAETQDENDFCEKTYGRRPLDLMEQWECVGEDVSYAHGIYFTDEEMNRLAGTGTHIAHCPSSNMRLGSGICRVKEMLPLGINVGLAVDGAASNDSSDMLGEIRTALMLQRVHYGAAAMTAREVFKIATENGARLLNFPKTGKIREGWAADIAIFNIGKMEYSGAHSDPLGALIFSGYNHGAEYTIVNGNIAVDKGTLTHVDEADLTAKCNDLADKLMKQR